MVECGQRSGALRPVAQVAAALRRSAWSQPMSRQGATEVRVCAALSQLVVPASVRPANVSAQKGLALRSLCVPHQSGPSAFPRPPASHLRVQRGTWKTREWFAVLLGGK